MKHQSTRKKRKSRTKKKQSHVIQRKNRDLHFGYVQEILLLISVVCAVGCFLVSSPWAGYLLSGAVLSFLILLINSLFNRKLQRCLDAADKKMPKAPEESGWEAVSLMHGLKHKNHYENLPPEAKQKSLFGKFE